MTQWKREARSSSMGMSFLGCLPMDSGSSPRAMGERSMSTLASAAFGMLGGSLRSASGTPGCPDGPEEKVADRTPEGGKSSLERVCRVWDLVLVLVLVWGIRRAGRGRRGRRGAP